MLQRTSFVQKRHVELTSARCRYTVSRSTFHSMRLQSTVADSPKAARRQNVSPRRSTSAVSKSSPKLNQRHHVPPDFKSPNFMFQPIRDNLEAIKRILALGSTAAMVDSVKDSAKLSTFFSNPTTVGNLVDTLARSSQPDQVLQTLDLVHTLGETPAHKVYELACFHLWSKKHWDHVIAVTHYAKEHVGATTAKLLNWRATALMQKREYSLLHDILTEFKDAKLLPDQSTYHIILTGCTRNYDLEGSKRCLRDMKEAGFAVSAMTRCLISKSFKYFGADTEVRENAIASLPELPIREKLVVINNLLRFSLDQDDFETVARILPIFNPSNRRHLESILSSTAGKFGSAQHVATESETIPDAETYAVVMSWKNKKEQPEEAIELWKRAATDGISATPNVIAALIHAYFLRGDGDTAIRMVAGISRPSDKKEFHSLLNAPSATAEEIPLLNIAGPALTLRACNVLLDVLLKRQGLDCVPLIFSIMHSHNLEPTNRTIEILMSYLNKAQEPRPRDLFRIAKKLAPFNQPSSRHLHHIFSCIIRDEKRLFLDSAWKKRPNDQQRPSNERHQRVRLLHRTDTFDPNGGMEFSNHLSYADMAKPIIQPLKAQKVKSDPALIFLRMRCDAMLHLEVESAVEVFRSLLTRGLRPTAHHIAALVEGYALSGDFSSAKALINAGKEVNITPNVVMYTIIISAHARHRNPTSARQIFDEMVSLGIKPDVPSIDALVSAYFAANDTQTARVVLKDLWPSIQPFPDSFQDADLATLIAHFRTLHPYRSKSVPFERPRRHAIRDQVKRVIQAHKQYFTPPLRDIKEQDKDGILEK